MEREKKEKKGKEGQEGLFQAIKAFSVLGGVGIYLVVFVGICVYLGDLADSALGLGAKGKFAGILIGFPGAIYTLFRQLRRSGMV